MNEPYRSKRALVVDDSSTIRLIVGDELKRMGFRQENIQEAGDGKIAFKALGQAHFDLIICDWNMPQMNGLSLLKSVKKDEKFKEMPFLMVTSETDKEKIAEAFESGADQYITKPFKAEHLEQTIHQLMFGPPTYADKKILVVDDSSTMRQIIKKNLKQLGFAEENISESKDGEDAINKLCEEPVDVIITDWHMPKVGGMDFIRCIKANDTLKHIPVIMVTTETTKEKVVEALKMGLSDYIIKPFNALDLQQKIKKVFGNN